MRMTRWIQLVAVVSLVIAIQSLLMAPVIAGEVSEFQRTTADVVLVENISVENGSPNDVRLSIPQDDVPPGGSANPIFIPAGAAGAHVFATLILPETVLPPTQPPMGRAVAWWDIIITVQAPGATTAGQDVMISIDKDVLNNTPYHWTDFHMEVGRGIGPEFVQSNEFDFLFFKTDPPPVSTDGRFMDPPKQDEPIAPDVLWWDWNPPANPGAPPGSLSRFWLGINVPSSMFNSAGIAVFTLREHATIPEPAAMLLFCFGATAFAGYVRRRADR